MSMAPRDPKWSSDSLSCAGQAAFVQRRTTSPSGRAALEPQTGHRSGADRGTASAGRRSSKTLTMCGITSPARSTTTVSPLRTSRRWTSLKLCSVVLLMVTPAMRTGASTAAGVSAPVRPTLTLKSMTCVSALRAENL